MRHSQIAWRALAERVTCADNTRCRSASLKMNKLSSVWSKYRIEALSLLESCDSLPSSVSRGESLRNRSLRAGAFSGATCEDGKAWRAVGGASLASFEDG